MGAPCTAPPRRIRTPGLLALAAAAAPCLAQGPEVGPPPIGVEVTTVTRLFWVDPPGGAPPPPASRALLLGYAAPAEVLAEEEPGGWAAGRGRALVVVAEAGAAAERFVVSHLGRNDAGDRVMEPERSFGVRFATPRGRFNILFPSQMDTLPGFARAEMERRMELLRLERKLYQETYYRLSGLHHTEVRWITALGPDLVVLPRRWLRILDGERAPGRGRRGVSLEEDACMKLGPFQMCVDVPPILHAVARGRQPRNRTQVHVRKIWSEGGTACGMAVWTRPFHADSPIHFRVRAARHGVLGSLRPGALPPGDAPWAPSGARPPEERAPRRVPGGPRRRCDEGAGRRSQVQRGAPHAYTSGDADPGAGRGGETGNQEERGPGGVAAP